MPVQVPPHVFADLWVTHASRAAVMLFQARRRFAKESMK